MMTVLRIRPGAELATARRLAGKGHDVCVPIEWRSVRPSRHVRRRLWRQAASMPGYAFLPAEAVDWPAVIGVDGVHGPLLAGDGQPAMIGEADAARMRDLGCTLKPDHDPYAQRRYRQGEHVRITSGPYQGQVVRIRRVSGKWLRTRVRMLGAEVDATIAADKVEPADSKGGLQCIPLRHRAAGQRGV